MERNLEVITLEACPNCLVLVKVEAKHRPTIIRLSLEADIYILADIPSVALLKAK